MSLFGSNLGDDPIGFGPTHELVLPEIDSQRLMWIFRFCGYSMTEVQTNIVAQRTVGFYLQLDHDIKRFDEVRELENQWNSTGRP